MKQTANTESQSPLFLKQAQKAMVPALGFGTYELEGDECRSAVRFALETGYRHVDTASVYGNEEQVGQGIAESNTAREEIFLTSKIWRDDLKPEALRRELDKSLQALQTDYLDLLLIHWPNELIPLEHTLHAMQECQEQGTIKHIGVSNFPPSLFEKAISCAPVFCNQVEYHPLLEQSKLLDIARNHDVILTAYSPLAQGEVIGYPVLEDIANKYGKSSEQVALRWLLEQDQVVTIPRSSKPEHIESNFDIFDFELDEEDHRLIADLPKDQRQIDPSFAPDWERS